MMSPVPKLHLRRMGSARTDNRNALEQLRRLAQGSCAQSVRGDGRGAGRAPVTGVTTRRGQ